MRTTDLPSWLWLPLKDNCEWDSPFNMGNCFDEQYHNVFFFLMKTLIYLTRFTTFPFVLFVAGMHGKCMANLPMAILSIITIIPMILLRLIWAEDYHTYGGMGNPMVAYSVKTWVILSMPNIVSWAPSAAFAVSQWARIVRETIVSLRIQAYSSFDAETLFPVPFAGRDLDSDLGESGAEAWMKKLVQEDQDRRRTRREEEESVAAEQRRLEQASLLVQKLEDDNDIAIWKGISKRRPQSNLGRRPALTHRQEIELLAEERGLAKKQFLAQRYVVVLVDKSTQTDPNDFVVHRVMKTPVSQIAYVSQGVQSDLAESPVRTQVEPSEPAPTGSSPPPPSPPSARKTTPADADADADAAITTTTTTTTTPQTHPAREPAPSAVFPRQEVVEPTTPLPSLPPAGVGVVSSFQVVDEPDFRSEEELPPQAIIPITEPAGLEPLQHPPSPEQVAGSVASLAQEIPGIPDIPEELLITEAMGSEEGREESLHQRHFQTSPRISPAWNPFASFAPTDIDAALDALITSGDEGDCQDWDEMAVDDYRPAEDVEMEGQEEGEVEVLTSSQAVDSVMEEAGTEPMKEEEEHDWVIDEASWAALEAFFDGDEDEFCDEPSQMAIDQFATPAQALSVLQLPLPQFHRPQPAQQAPIFHFEVSQQTHTPPPDYGMSEQEQEDLEMEMEAAFDTEMEDAEDTADEARRGRTPEPATMATKEQMERRKVLKPRLRTAGASHHPAASPSVFTQQAPLQPTSALPTAIQQAPPQPTPAPSIYIQRAPLQSTPAQPTTIQQTPPKQNPPTSVLPKTADPSDTTKQQQTVAPIMMGGLMLPGSNRIITNTEAPAPIPAAAPTPTIAPEQKAAFEKKKQTQIKAQQEARRNKKPSLFHQSKRPATPAHITPSTPRQQGTPNQSKIPSSTTQIKDSSVRAAAEAIFGTPGSGQKKDGPKILASIPSHLRDQVAGRTTENEDENED